VTDEKNVSHTTAACEVILIVGSDDSHFLSLIFLTDKRKKGDIYSLMTQYLDKYVVVSGTGTTDFGSPAAQLTYTDVDKQSQEFRDALRNLVKYGILTAKNVFD